MIPKAAPFPIICFSHLAWDEKLFQRPQQLMQRLAAKGHTICYFACIGAAAHRAAPMAGPLDPGLPLHIYTLPYSPYARKARSLRRWLAALKVARLVNSLGLSHAVHWYYHPALFSLGYSHKDLAIIYDVMDHFPSFENQLDDFYFDELTIIAEADLIFTGGHSLQKHILSLQQELAAPVPGAPLSPVVCLPSGIDLPHFEQALSSPHVSNFPRPIFGYFGAVDERLDWPLISALAQATTGTVIIAGPPIQAPPADLPANIQLPGAIPYAALPALLSSFDVALIPFRSTPLVQYISPTKTPEYLAGGKPVVSVPIPDVQADYGDLVTVAATHQEFINACLHAAASPPSPQALNNAVRARTLPWDQIINAMEQQISAHLSGPGDTLS